MSHGLSVCCFLPRPAPSLRPPPRSRSAPSPQPAEGGTEPFLFLISASPGHQRLLASRLGALPGPLTEVPARTHMVQAPFQSSTPSYQQVRGCTSPFSPSQTPPVQPMQHPQTPISLPVALSQLSLLSQDSHSSPACMAPHQTPGDRSRTRRGH